MTINWMELIDIDTKIYVWNIYANGEPGIRHQAHWAGISYNSKPQAWRAGKTSWSGTSKKVWDKVEVAK